MLAYIIRQGGTFSLALNDLASRLWAWCKTARNFPFASHIPGEENLIADFLSRGKCLPSEWMLSPVVFRQIMSVFGVLDIDLFATSLYHRLPRFCSRFRDLGAFALDAFAIPWGGGGLMPFSPFALIPRVLRKIRENQASVILIVPWWPARSWFQDLLALLLGTPWSLPCSSDLVSQPLSDFRHLDPEILHPPAWPLSGRRLVHRVSLFVQHNFLFRIEESQPELSTTLGWKLFTLCVRKWASLLERGVFVFYC